MCVCRYAASAAVQNIRTEDSKGDTLEQGGACLRLVSPDIVFTRQSKRQICAGFEEHFQRMSLDKPSTS